MTDLSRLIDVVNVKLAGVAPVDWKQCEDSRRWHADGERIAQALRDEHGARIRLDRDPATMAMGGIKTSATGGWEALMRNWVHAARRRLVAER